MVTPIKAKDLVANVEREDFETVKKYEVVDALYGVRHVSLTDEDIKTLKEGYYLYSNDWEYATIISYVDNKEEM